MQKRVFLRKLFIMCDAKKILGVKFFLGPPLAIGQKISCRVPPWSVVKKKCGPPLKIPRPPPARKFWTLPKHKFVSPSFLKALAKKCEISLREK